MTPEELDDCGKHLALESPQVTKMGLQSMTRSGLLMAVEKKLARFTPKSSSFGMGGYNWYGVYDSLVVLPL
jgi:hypothetical protein